MGTRLGKRWQWIGLVAVVVAIGCEEKLKDPRTGEILAPGEQPAAQQPKPQQIAPQPPPAPVPERQLDIRQVLGATRANIKETLGAPVETNDDEQEFQFEGVNITVAYRYSRAWRLFLSQENSSAVRLLTWLGLSKEPFEVNGTRYIVEEADSQGFGMMWLTSTAFPKVKLDANKLLGATKKQVEKVLGKEYSKGTHLLEEHGVMIDVSYWKDHPQDGNRTQRVEINFGPGVHGQERLNEILSALKVRASEGHVTIRKRKFKITADKLGVTFERRFL